MATSPTLDTFAALVPSAYAASISASVSVAAVEDFYAITTGELDSHNDHVEIYLLEDASGHFLSDDGATYGSILESHVDPESPFNALVINAVLAQHYCYLAGSEIRIDVTPADIGASMTSLLAAMRALRQNNIF